MQYVKTKGEVLQTMTSIPEACQSLMDTFALMILRCLYMMYCKLIQTKEINRNEMQCRYKKTFRRLPISSPIIDCRPWTHVLTNLFPTGSLEENQLRLEDGNHSISMKLLLANAVTLLVHHVSHVEQSSKPAFLRTLVLS